MDTPGCGYMDGEQLVDPPGPHAALTCRAHARDEVVQFECPACGSADACPPCLQIGD
jgi:hypothetical protein